MSGYRSSYSPWTKSSSVSSNYLGISKKDLSPKYESAYTRPRIEIKKPDEDKGTSSRLGAKIGAYSSGYQRDSSTSRDTGQYGSKSSLYKKDTLHPPVSYRPLSRTGAISRETSPVDKPQTSYNYNRLYPGTTYTRSTSRERNDSTSSSSSVPKYGTPRSRNDSKEDLTSRYKPTSTSKTSSKEDLSSGGQKYITSRFLPKNAVEKSYTAYTRPSALRISETSRKNRELLSVLAAQNEKERTSRPVSRCSPVTPDVSQKSESTSQSQSMELEESNEIEEMESVTVVNRCTSPGFPSQPNIQRTRRTEIARTVEKVITRSCRKKPMVDKEMQSDRLDDTSKYSRFGSNSARAAATPWCSFLDMKFSSPESDQKTDKQDDSSQNQSQATEDSSNKGKPNNSKSKEGSCSPKSISRANSIKNLSRSFSKLDMKGRDSKSKTPPSPPVSGDKKSKITPPRSNQSLDKKLPPQIPKSDNTNKPGQNTTLNKDFRKSVLNMSQDGKLKKHPKRSSSQSSAESGSEAPNSEATDVSENLTTCTSYHKSSSSTSKLPQRLTSDGSSRRSCTPSSDISSASSAPSGSEDDSRAKSKQESKLRKRQNTNPTVSRTSAMISAADELPSEKSPKPPLSPRVKTDGQRSEAEAKSFLMRALAPVTSLFKVRHVDSTDKVNWMDSSPENPNNDVQFVDNTVSPQTTEVQQHKMVLRRVESGEKAWWLDEESESVKQNARLTPEEKIIQKSIRHVDSGERPWWLDSNSEPPEGIQKYPSEHSQDENGRTLYKIRKNDSGCKEWWLDSSENNNTSSNKTTSENQEPEYLQGYRLRHIDSGERAWWMSSNENINEASKSEAVQKELENNKKTYKIQHQSSGEKAWWMDSHENVNESSKMEPGQQEFESNKNTYRIRHQSSGEKAWWMDSPEKELQQKQSDEDSDNDMAPLGDRASPEGLETPREEEQPGRTTPYDNVPSTQGRARRPANISLFISRHTNIDDILGGTTQLLSPLMDTIFSYRKNYEECEEIDPGQVRIHDSTAQRGVIEPGRIDTIGGFQKSSPASHGKLDDAALQLYKDGDYGSYLDLEASISEQQEEFEGFQLNKKNSIVLRTQLSVRVHTIIEKLLTSEGRELRRALFSLKQIFQEDKDLVHEFVQNDGLACLIKVGSEADQNYQNYILRALGQVMLYVDGMNGVMEHNQTVQWLYTLISSKFRLVVKTALKLLLVFAEYTDSNCLLLIKAINTVDCSQGLLPWHNIMKLLKDFDSADTELLIYAMTLINKVLNGIPDQDTYYDQTDALEEQGIETIIQRYMAKPGTDLDLLQQFQIYEAVLQYEDGEEKCGMPIRHLDESIRKTLRNRKSLVSTTERRKSRRHSTGTTPVQALNNSRNNNSLLQANAEDEDEESSSTHSSELNNLNGSYKDSNKANDAGVTPALRRRRERAERQRSFMREQQESVALLRANSLNSDENGDNQNGNYTNALQQRLANGNLLNRNSNRKDITPLMNAVNKLDSEESLAKQPWILSMMYGKSIDEQNQESAIDDENTNENDRKMLLQLKRENTVKDLTQKLANQNILHSPSEENKVNRIGDMSGLISKAKEGLAKSKSKADVLRSPTSDNVPKIPEIKKSENELRWEELMANLNRPLNLCDMDFTDLATDDETDILAPVAVANGIPPPPPPLLRENGSAPPPPPPGRIAPPPVPNPPMFGVQRFKSAETKIPIKKNKKTVKLFWKEVRDDPISSVKLKSGLIWDELVTVTVDTQKLEHLFESRAKDLLTKKQQEMNKNKEVIVLDPKRSNAINIGMTKLPPPRSIKTAILKMDATIMNREGIEKLLTMLPTEEERTKIQDAQAANPDLPLGSAEQFLLTLASISELPARLKLWAFKLDFENSEREIAEPLMDLKQGIEVLRVNKTFRGILSTLLSIGNFLNGNEVKGFQIEYLAKVPEVKDTVHKHSLLHHLCHIVMEKFPDATDLYSEIGAITRASKVDFDELTANIQHLEADCKASWDHLKLIAKHDGSTMMKVKMSDFLSDCAERIILLGIIHRRVMNRFKKFLLWLGIPLHQITDTKPNEFCRVVSEFALEYRTTRERVLQQLEKKANHRERNKTRGKMITEIGKFRTKEDKADAELRQLLGSDISDVESMQGTLPWRRQRRDGNRSFIGQANGNLTDGDDEILESLVKTATKAPTSRTAPRERKRTRHADRKSLRRTLKNGLSEEEKKHLSTYIKGY